MNLKCLLSLLLLCSMFVNAAPPVGGNYILTYQDNFDSLNIDISAWNFRNDNRFTNSANRPQYVRMGNGCMNVDFKHELVDGVLKYTGGGIISKKSFGYGYYETKSRTFGDTYGLHSSFWVMGVSGDGLISPKFNQVIEIDGYEIDSPTKDSNVASNVHYYVGGHTELGGAKSTLANPATQFVVHGFEWTPTFIKWYTNGTLVRTVNNPSVYAAQNLWLSALGSTYFCGSTAIDDTKLPGASSWEYVKYYAKDMGGYNWASANDFEFNNGTGFLPTYVRDFQSPVCWCESGATVCSSVVKDSLQAYSGLSYLEHKYTAAYSVKTFQHCDYIPNGTYRLKAWVRSSGGQSVAQMIATGMGTADRAVNIPALNKWTQVTLDSIVVANNSCEIGFSSNAGANQWLNMDKVEFVQIASSAPISFVRDSGVDAILTKSSTPSTNSWATSIGVSPNAYQPNSTATVVTDNNNNSHFSCSISANITDNSKWYLSNFTQLTVDTVKAQNYTLKLRTRTSVPTDSTYFQLKLSATSNLGAAIVTGIQNNSPEISWEVESPTSTAITSKQIRIKPSSTWKTYTANLTLSPVIASPMRVYFTFPRAGTFEIDDVSLELSPAMPIRTSLFKPDQDFAKIEVKQGVVYLQSGSNEKSQVEIFNFTGRSISKNDFCGQFQSSPLQRGIYIIRISTNNCQQAKKIIIE